MTGVPDSADMAELDRELLRGVHEMMHDAAGHDIQRDQLPVGHIEPGKTLLQFWHLDFPFKGPNYNTSTVITLMQEMLSVRRLSPPAANALGYRIYTTLPAAYGAEGKVMAAMLIARCRQAIIEPEAWPSLLDDDELKAAYAVYRQDERGYEFAAAAVGLVSRGPSQLKNRVNRNTNLPEWLRGMTRALTLFSDRIKRRLPYRVRSAQIPSGGFNKEGKPFKIDAMMLLLSYVTGILSLGAYNNRVRAEAYRNEMIRRGIPVS